jgi:hypothetical protein
VQVVYSSRKLNQVEAWQRDGREAVLVDLDLPETFPDARSLNASIGTNPFLSMDPS